jgi:hypothetical protein
MISDDGNRISGSLKILLPFRKSEDNSQKFSVIDVVVSFGGDECLGKVGAWMKITIGVFLEEDGARCQKRSVGHNGKGSGGVRDQKDWS